MTKRREPKIYVRKPVKVAAIKVTVESADSVVEWLSENGFVSKVNWGARKLHYFTPHKRTLSFGDWLIRSGNGEFYPTKGHNFPELYEVHNA